MYTDHRCWAIDLVQGALRERRFEAAAGGAARMGLMVLLASSIDPSPSNWPMSSGSILNWLKLSELSEYRLKSELLVCVDCAVDGRLSHSGLDSRLL